jgi:RNA polymerase sigma-70 factor, ECF subfamily
MISLTTSGSRREPFGILSVRAQPGLDQLVTRLYEEAREDLYRYSLTFGLAPGEAQEAAQEVFLRLYTALKKGEEIQNPRAWCFRVAHNLSLQIRARQAPQLPFDPNLEAKLARSEPGQEANLIERQRMLRVHQAIEGLSEQQKRCLFLRMEGLRYPEIAEVLGIGASTVGEFLRRAVTRLRKASRD